VQFGGDPTKVTIFGESAGGESIKQLLANPPSPLTFSSAILQSENTVLVGMSVPSALEIKLDFCTCPWSSNTFEY
jgi:carboxylesterase 2